MGGEDVERAKEKAYRDFERAEEERGGGCEILVSRE